MTNSASINTGLQPGVITEIISDALLDETKLNSEVPRITTKHGKSIIDANGVIHTSPGQRPGFMAVLGVAGQRPAS